AEPRLRGGLLGELEGLRDALAIVDHILREAERYPLLRTIGPSGQHHINHSRGADQPRNADRAAATDEDSEPSFRQGIIGAALGNPNMRGSGKLQTAADHRALQYGDHGYLRMLDLVECPMKRSREANAGLRTNFRERRQIGSGGKVLPLAIDDDGARAFRRVAEEALDARDHRGIERIPLGRAGQAQKRDRTTLTDDQTVCED